MAVDYLHEGLRNPLGGRPLLPSPRLPPIQQSPSDEGRGCDEDLHSSPRMLRPLRVTSPPRSSNGLASAPMTTPSSRLGLGGPPTDSHSPRRPTTRPRAPLGRRSSVVDALISDVRTPRSSSGETDAFRRANLRLDTRRSGWSGAEALDLQTTPRAEDLPARSPSPVARIASTASSDFDPLRHAMGSALELEERLSSAMARRESRKTSAGADPPRLDMKELRRIEEQEEETRYKKALAVFESGAQLEDTFVKKEKAKKEGNKGIKKGRSKVVAAHNSFYDAAMRELTWTVLPYAGVVLLGLLLLKMEALIHRLARGRSALGKALSLLWAWMFHKTRTVRV